MNRVFIHLALCSALLTPVGCARRATTADLVNLEAPNDLAFACVRRTRDARRLTTIIMEELVPLERCNFHHLLESDDDLPDPDPCFEGTDTTPEGQVTDCELHAVLTELFAGTVGSINVTQLADQSGDLSIQVPALTFLSVGERPSGLAVWDKDSSYTWVSNFGTRDVQVVSTKTILNLEDAPPIDPFPPAETILPVSQGPTDLVISPTGHFLYVALEEAGTVLEVAIDPATGEFVDTGTVLTLDGVAAQVPAPPIGQTEDNDYFRYCPPERSPLTLAVAPRTPIGESADPRPVELTIDPVDNVLLVSDRAKPLIHRFQLGTDDDTPTPATPLDPIHVAVPTLDIAVTPAVPKTFLTPSGSANASATERYLYAVDATDGSVLVADYTEGSPTFGAVLPVGSDGSPVDRLSLGAGLARTLSVLTPDYPEDAATIPSDSLCQLTDNDAAANAIPTALRGVFLSVGLSDGTVRVVDIFDLDATCRGGNFTPGSNDCTGAINPNDSVVSIRRNRPRINTFLTQSLTVSATPVVRFNQTSGALEESTGQLEVEPAPGLEPIECPDRWVNLYGDPDPLVCANDEPWVTASERWDSEWEAEIPFAGGGLGSLQTESLSAEAGNWLVADQAGFCLFGLLGGFNVAGLAPTDPEAGYFGDQLVITGELPPLTQAMEELTPGPCARFFDNVEDLDDNPVSFAILEARMGELRLGAPLSNGYTFDDVMSCYDTLVSYEIRTRRAYTVTGTNQGFVHRVTADDLADPQSTCIIDPEKPIETDDPTTYLNARAFEERPFLNPFVSFEISAFPETVPSPPPLDTESIITFTTDNRANQLLLRTGQLSGQRISSLPESLVYLPLDDRLYLADLTAGFTVIVLQPFTLALNRN